MDIFERDKLPVVATVEQVCLSSGGSYCFVLHRIYLELFNGCDRAR